MTVSDDGSEGRPRARAARKDATRRKLLDAAQRLFTEKGFFETRAGDIAKEAGVAHGTMFAHFGSKAGLLLRLLENFTNERIEALDRFSDEARAKGATPEEEFWSTLREIWRSDLENLGLIRAYASYSWLWDNDLEAAHKQLRRANRLHLAKLLGRVETDVPDTWPTLEHRVALFYAEYREMLRVYQPGSDDLLWTHLERTVDFLFQFSNKPGKTGAKA